MVLGLMRWHGWRRCGVIRYSRRWVIDTMRKLMTRRLALPIMMISSGIGMMCSMGCFRGIGLSRPLGEDYIYPCIYGEGLIGVHSSNLY